MSAGEPEAGRQLFFPVGSMVDVILPDGEHRYWSTHCRHGDHDACRAVELAPGVPRKPAQCKGCGAACRCPCGHPAPAGGVRLTREEHRQAIRIVGAVKRGNRLGLLLMCAGPDCGGAEMFAPGFAVPDVETAADAHIDNTE